MTLKMWCDFTDILPTTPTTEKGAVSVIIDQFHPMRKELFWLEDYLVSTCAGIVVWLLPRK